MMKVRDFKLNILVESGYLEWFMVFIYRKLGKEVI